MKTKIKFLQPFTACAVALALNLTFLTAARAFNDRNWSALGSGMNGQVLALVVATNGDLYAGGYFTNAGGIAANYIAKWNGRSWSALGSGTSGYPPWVQALAVSGTNLYAGGNFTNAGGVAANAIAKWDGHNWSALGSGRVTINGTDYGISSVQSLALATNGDLYVGGFFTNAPVAFIVAKWDGNNWSALGAGSFDATIDALVVSGNNVYAGGDFGTYYIPPGPRIALNYIAKWDGNNWSALGAGVLDSDVDALVLDGTNLYVGGSFTTAGGIAANKIAIWDINGHRWAALGSGIAEGGEEVDALAVSWHTLYVGGAFATAGGQAASSVA